MSRLLGACATFEYEHGRPMLTSIVVSGKSLQPGKGFWTIQGIPIALRMKVADQEGLDSLSKDDRREAFWIQEMRKVDSFWKAVERSK